MLQKAPETPATYRSVLAIGEFRAVMAAQLLSLLGDQMARVALSIIVFQRSHSAFLSALTFALTFLPWVVGGPLLSVFADTLPRREVMVTCDLVRAGLIACMVVPGMPIYALFALLLLSCLLAPPFEAARSALLPDILDGDDYVVGQSLSSIIFQSSQVIGLLTGGLLVRGIGARTCLAVDAATFVGSAVAVRCWTSRRSAVVSRGREQTGWMERSTQGFRVVFGSATLSRILMLAWTNAAIAIVPEALAVAYASRIGGGAGAAGLLTAAEPAGVLTGAFLVGRLVLPGQRISLMRPLALLAALPLLVTALRPGVSMTWTLWVLAGAGCAFQLPANAAFVAGLPAELRGRAFAVAQSGLQVVQGLAVAVAGVATRWLGVETVIALSGFVGTVVVLALCWNMPAELAPRRGRHRDPLAQGCAP